METLKLSLLCGNPLLAPFGIGLYTFIHKLFPDSPQAHTQYNVLDLHVKHIILCFTVLETIIT
jgi:hypothetical protein